MFENAQRCTGKVRSEAKIGKASPTDSGLFFCRGSHGWELHSPFSSEYPLADRLVPHGCLAHVGLGHTSETVINFCFTGRQLVGVIRIDASQGGHCCGCQTEGIINNCLAIAFVRPQSARCPVFCFGFNVFIISPNILIFINIFRLFYQFVGLLSFASI